MVHVGLNSVPILLLVKSGERLESGWEVLTEGLLRGN